MVGVMAIYPFLDKKNGPDRRHDSFIIDLLDYVLQHNYINFNRKFYRQVSDTAVGAKCAPPPPIRQPFFRLVGGGVCLSIIRISE